MSWRELPTNPSPYTGASSSELGYGTEVTASHLFEYHPEGGQRLGVYATQPIRYGAVTPKGENEGDERPPRTIIVPAAGEYRIEPFWAIQMQQMATQFNARVVGVEMPGTVGLTRPNEQGEMEVYHTTNRLSGATQTIPQLFGAVRGDFSRHVNVQLNAVADTVGLDTQDEYVLYGTSMGATIATEMLNALQERGLHVSEIILHEMVNAFSGTRPAMLAKVARLITGTEQDRRLKYIAENAAIGHPVTAFELSGDTSEERARHKELDDARKGLGQQAISGGANMIGMIHGRQDALLNSLHRYGPSERPRVSLVRGRESAAATEADYVDLHVALALGDCAVRTFTVIDASPGDRPVAMGHAHHFSIARLHEILKTLARRY